MGKIPIPEDLTAERAGIYRQSALAFVLCAGVLGTAVWWLPRQLEFPADTGERLAFAMRASLLIVVWIVIGVRMVSGIRRHSAQDNPGSAYGPPSERIKVPLAFLQNTLEQATMATFGNLALATVEGDAPLAFIMGSVLLFAIGRIAFLRGYPHGAAARAFGMATTALPIVGAVVWVIYDLVRKTIRAAA